ncbi:type II toxin-antitoxin system YafQ family toxin [Granulicella tundricola]|uniref:Addiction module toxin, RelE/StbE family n=1 Tax=Granulicella tundricola (strain ATCC BAA-1859 / DSM 23138 / MP5ACTX9) TaxID=1198114 RepID=E8X3Z4_GRATM|nr:addiction module toxin, RelE/StbE family [Granulicella tundricola MP5ACTX9]
MLEVVMATRFRRDTKLMERRGLKMTKLREVIMLLAQEIELPVRYHDHLLSGSWKDHRECHVEPDWLLIYQLQEGQILFARTGTHADLFAK